MRKEALLTRTWILLSITVFVAADTNETGGHECWHEDNHSLTGGKGWPVHKEQGGKNSSRSDGGWDHQTIHDHVSLAQSCKLCSYRKIDIFHWFYKEMLVNLKNIKFLFF